MPSFPLGFGIVIVLLCVGALLPFSRSLSRRILRLNASSRWRRALRLGLYFPIGLFLVLGGLGGLHDKTEQKTATAKIEVLLADARNALGVGEIDTAKEKIETASLIGRSFHPSQRADVLAPARELNSRIRRGTDSSQIRKTLIELPDEAFRELKEAGTLPTQITSGYQGLDNRTAQLAKAELEEVAVVRKERHLAQLATARERQEEAQRQAAAARKAEDNCLDAYMAVLNAAEVKLIKNVSVRRISDHIWEATLTVENIWHIRHNQIRMQDAQALWEAWAKIASPQNPDSARIKLVDLRGNEVGGSRILAGSLIWVKDD